MTKTTMEHGLLVTKITRKDDMTLPEPKLIVGKMPKQVPAHPPGPLTLRVRFAVPMREGGVESKKKVGRAALHACSPPFFR
jgi:hypothetical protein